MESIKLVVDTSSVKEIEIFTFKAPHNNHMHSDSKKQSEERAVLFAVGDVRR